MKYFIILIGLLVSSITHASWDNNILAFIKYKLNITYPIKHYIDIKYIVNVKKHCNYQNVGACTLYYYNKRETTIYMPIACKGNILTNVVCEKYLVHEYIHAARAASLQVSNNKHKEEKLARHITSLWFIHH